MPCRLCEAYRRMYEPAAIEIDASGTKERVVEEVLKALKSHDIYLNGTS